MDRSWVRFVGESINLLDVETEAHGDYKNCWMLKLRLIETGVGMLLDFKTKTI